MGNSIQPSRRATGIMSLILACMLVPGWIRSFFAHDSIAIPLTNHAKIGVLSVSQSLFFCLQYKKNIENKWAITEWTPRFDPLDTDGVYGLGGAHGIGLFHAIPCLRSSRVASIILQLNYGVAVMLIQIVALNRFELFPLPTLAGLSKLLLVIVIALVVITLFSGPPIQ